MTTSPAVDVRPLTDRQAFLDLDQWAFAFPEDPDDELKGALEPFEWDRTFGAWLDDQLAGIHAVWSLDLPVPGAHLPCAGLTWVGVHPQFRRRGVLRAMIAHHLAHARDRGEAVSALHASEPDIYGRYGYGAASRRLLVKVPRGARLREVPGSADVPVRLERLDAARHADVVGDCWEAARGERPGWVSRDTPALRRRALHDPRRAREQAEPLRILVADGDGDGPARGYAVFRRRSRWDDDIVPDGTVAVQEFVARDPAATHALWSRLLDLDLMSRVEADLALDDPLLFLLTDARSAAPRLFDNLWVRLLDVGAALAARRYAAPVDVVLGVTDELVPGNARRWHLEGGPDGAACTPTSAPADVHLDVRELGAAYLGGETLMAAAAAGLVQADDPAALRRAATGFQWPVAPTCPSYF